MTKRDIPRFEVLFYVESRALKQTNFYFLSENVAEKSIFCMNGCSEWLSQGGLAARSGTEFT